MQQEKIPHPAAASGRREMSLPTQDVFTPDGNRLISPERVANLLPSIRTEGQLVPGLVAGMPEAPGKWVCVAGNRRLYCCRFLGMPFRAVEVEGATDQTRLVKLSITDNNFRQQLTLLELGEQIQQYADLTGITGQTDLAGALGLTCSEVSKALALPKRLAPALHDIARDRAVPRTHVELIACVPDHGEQEKLMAWAIETKPTRDALERKVLHLRGKRPKATRPLTLRLGAARVEMKDPSLDAVKALAAKLAEAAKSFEKSGCSAELLCAVLPGLLK